MWSCRVPVAQPRICPALGAKDTAESRASSPVARGREGEKGAAREKARR